MKRRRSTRESAAVDPAYVVLLRRELTRSQARLKRAEWERDQLHSKLEQLQALLTKRAVGPAKSTKRKRATPRS